MSEGPRTPAIAAPGDEAGEGWGEARPVHIPRPTAWPAICAAGVVLLFWSVSASPVVAAVGGIVFFFAVGGWVRELVHERHVERSEQR